MEISDLLLAIAIGGLLGIGLVLAFVWYRVVVFSNRVESLIDEAIKEVEDSLVGLYVERENGLIYCYDHTDKQYICQGSTFDEIKTAFHTRFPNKVAYLAGGDETLITELKQAISENIINK